MLAQRARAGRKQKSSPNDSVRSGLQRDLFSRFWNHAAVEKPPRLRAVVCDRKERLPIRRHRRRSIAPGDAEIGCFRH